VADITVGGQKKHVVMQAPKNGVMYVIEVATGKVVSADPFVPSINWATGFDEKDNWKPILNPDANFGKTGKGWYVVPFQTHVWNPQSYNPDTGLFYVTVRNATYGMVAKAGAKMGNQLLSIIVGGPDANPQGARPQVQGDASWLSAWNPATQTEAWRVVGGGSGTMTTAGNLVFQTERTNLVAYRADNGEKVWQGALGVNGGSGAMSYEIDGTQYIAAIANARVVAFKLGGNAELPPAAAPVSQVLNPPSRFGTAEQLAAGESSYTQSCTICHEGQARNSTGAPDLSYSPFLANNALFSSVVIDGIKVDGGMKSFKGALSPADVEAIRAHLVKLANDLKDNPAPARGGLGGFPGGGAPGGGGARRGGGPGGAGGAPAQPAAPAEAPVGLHQ
jgi:alcohol dehydrogenase (cytochrome c)/quinohemoprotein ethanol dehydrogenase